MSDATSLTVDPAASPFSCAGSWMSLAVPAARFQPHGPGLYLRSHHSRPLAPREIAVVELVRDGSVLPAVVSATAGQLELRAADAVARFAFAGPDDLVVDVHGAALRLRACFGGRLDRSNAGHFSAFREAADRVTFNARPALRRFAIEAWRGTVSLEAAWDGEVSAEAVATLSAGAHARIHEYWSTWTPLAPVGVAEAAAARSAEFATFASAWPGESTASLAAWTLWSCTMRPCGLLRRRSVFMSLNWMDQVWSWDNLFNAVALADADEDLAFDQIMLLADLQDGHGAYPDGFNDGFLHYNYSKPPVQGVLFDLLAQRRPAFWTAARRDMAHDTTERFVRWWLDHRSDPASGLCYYLHGNDSGWDNGTLLREGAPLVAPDLNAFLVRCCDWLAAGADLAGRSRTAAAWRAESARLTERLLAVLWTGAEFAGLHLPSGRLVGSHSLVALMPGLLGARLDAAQRGFIRARAERCLAPAGLASEAPDSPLYVADGYWRGPVWGPSTLLAVLALRAVGEEDLADQAARRYRATCARSGFAENFDAVSGAALRDPAYTWTASAHLLLGGEPQAARR